MEINITKNNFEAEVLRAEKPVVLDFWASWCGPCRMLAPELEKLAEKYDGKILVGKVNVDTEPELAQSHGIESIPTLLLYENGTVKSASVGYKNLEGLEQWLQI